MFLLLQTNWDINVYAFAKDGYTKYSARYEVKARTKPADYVYNPTEVKTYDNLESRIDDIAENYSTKEYVNDAISNTVENYTTKEYVDNAISNIDFPSRDCVKLEYDTKPIFHIEDTLKNESGVKFSVLGNDGDINDKYYHTKADENVIVRLESENDKGCAIFVNNNLGMLRENEYRIRLSLSDGAQVCYGGNRNGDYGDVLGGNRWVKDKDYGPTLPRSFKAGNVYSLRMKKEKDTLMVKAWLPSATGGVEPTDWQFVYSAPSIGSADGNDTYSYEFRLHYTNKGNDDEKALIFHNMDFNGALTGDNVLENKETAEQFFKFAGLSCWNWGSKYLEASGDIGTLTTKRFSGDYELFFQFEFKGDIFDGAYVERDEGLYILPMKDSSNPYCTGYTKEYTLNVNELTNDYTIVSHLDEFGGNRVDIIAGAVCNDKFRAYYTDGTTELI